MTNKPAHASLWRRWWARHDGRHLLFALPALVGLAVLVVFLAAARPSRAELANRYLSEGISLDAQGDRSGARLCYDRLQLLEVKDPEVLHSLGVKLYQRGDERRGLKILNDLAPLDRRGYPPAQVWQARRQLDIFPQTPETREQARQHLELALRDRQFDDPEAEQLLGETCLKIGVLDRSKAATAADPEERKRMAQRREAILNRAEAVLHKAVTRRPEALLSLARVSNCLQKGPESLKFAEQVIKTNEDRLKVDAQNHKARLQLAQGLLFRGDFQKAIDQLEEGRRIQDSQDYRSTLASVYFTWFLTLGRQPDSATEQMAKLEKIQECDPDNPDLIEALQLLIRGDDIDVRYRALEALEKLAKAEGKTAAQAHGALGEYYLQRNPPVLIMAKTHLEEAIRLAPLQPYLKEAAAAIIYHVLIQLPNPEMDKAMSLAHDWVTRFPDDPHLRQGALRFVCVSERATRSVWPWPT